jgi:exosortase
MDATARTEPPSRDGFLPEFQRLWGALPDKAVIGVLLAAWVLLFHYYGWTTAMAGRTGSLFSWMWTKWDDPANDASHGKLIPWVVLWLLWMRRGRLARSVAGVWGLGLVAVGLALALHVAGFVVQQPRLSMVAFFFGAWGLVGLVWGWEALRVTFFPFFIFAFCVPMGGTFAQGLTLPLRNFAAWVTTFITRDGLQIAVARNGTTLTNPSGLWHYEVAAECSGIRSFTALLGISTIFSVLTIRSLWKRAVMIGLTVPIALICNVLRLTTIILAAAAYRSQAAGDFVDKWFGYITYLIAIGLLLLVGRWLREKPLSVPP